MKLITLNAWVGRLYEPYMKFLSDYASDTDIFCFQDFLFGDEPKFSEIEGGRINIFQETQKALRDFKGFAQRDQNESYFDGGKSIPNIGCGQAIFTRDDINVLEDGGFRSHLHNLHYHGGDMVSGRCHWIRLNLKNNEELTIFNLHGLWQRNSQKKDTLERIEQSQKVKEFLSGYEGKKIICGDFNLKNDGEAIRILEDGMVNLVKEYGITSTRSKYYPKEERFADYILTSPEIKINDFKVLPDEVSDHLPLWLDFE